MRLNYDEAEVPHQMKDEDLWFRFFTKSQLVILVPIIVILFLITRFFLSKGLLLIGIVIDVIVGLIAGIVVMVEVPEEQYLYGTGNPLYKPLLATFMRKFNVCRKLYTKFFDK